jgi:hypothetical protein
MPSHPTPNPAHSNANRIALAARISLVCPFLVILLALLAGQIELPFRTYVELAAGLVALLGLFSGMAALVQGRRAAGSSVAIQGGIGLLISLVFVGIVLSDYLETQQRIRAERRIDGSTVLAGVDPEPQRLAEALARFVGRKMELEQNLMTAAKPLGETPVLDMTGVESAAVLVTRRSMVETFMTASHALSNHLAQSHSFIQDQLVERGTAPAKAREIASGFLSNLESQLSASLQLRELEHNYSATLIQALDLLQQHWGAWKTQSNAPPVFEDEPAAGQYAALLRRLAGFEDRERALKQSLLQPE